MVPQRALAIQSSPRRRLLAKLTTQQIEEVQSQTGVTPIPEDNPAVEQLKGHFGDHTFYADRNGLHVWEQGEEESEDSETLTALRIAAWADEEKTALVPHEPVPSNAIVKLGGGTENEEEQ